MRKDPKKKNDKVLGSYRRVGTTFVPPMLQTVKPEYVSWASQTMPELIWWDVMFDKASHRFAAKVAAEIANYFKRKGNKEHYWAFLSNYIGLSDESAAELRAHLADVNLLRGLTESLGDFIELYPSCPAARLLDRRPTGAIDITYLSRFETRLSQLENKRSRNGVLIQAQVIYMAFLCDRYRVAEGLALANFPEVERYPETGESLRVGAAVCATVNMMAASSLPKYCENGWIQYFWRRSLELRPLTFNHLENNEL